MSHLPEGVGTGDQNLIWQGINGTFFSDIVLRKCPVNVRGLGVRDQMFRSILILL